MSSDALETPIAARRAAPRARDGSIEELRIETEVRNGEFCGEGIR